MSIDAGDLGQLKPAKGSVTTRKRIGRGRGSGLGDTAGKGDKGQKALAGAKVPVWFEGGQMPIQRRIPKRGFNIPDRTEFREVNLKNLDRVKGDVVNPEVLRASRLIKGRGPVVLMGEGEVSRKFTVHVHRITKSAEEKIKNAGGSVELLPIDPVDLRVKRGPKPKPKKVKAPK